MHDYFFKWNLFLCLAWPRMPIHRSMKSFTDSLTDNALAVINRPNKQSAQVTYSPSETDQRQQSSQGISGRFVVEYDIDRKTDAGDVLVRNSLFLPIVSAHAKVYLRARVETLIIYKLSLRRTENLVQLQKKTYFMLDMPYRLLMDTLYIFSLLPTWGKFQRTCCWYWTLVDPCTEPKWRRWSKPYWVS